MESYQLAEKLARGERVQELSPGQRPISANRLFRIFGERSTRVLKIYGTAARQRREQHALSALHGVPGLPVVLERGVQDDVHWTMFADSGRWSLGTLPENPSLARRAGAILQRLRDIEPTSMTNLERGIDQEWVTVDFISTFRRMERYRGRLGVSQELLDAARSVRPPFASEPIAAHTNATPDNFLVDDGGNVTLINWEWATLAPPEWDLSKATWLTGLRLGPAAAAAMQEGYGIGLDRVQLDRWTVYNAGMMLVYEAENRFGGRLDDLSYLVAELQRAVTGARGVAG